MKRICLMFLIGLSLLSCKSPKPLSSQESKTVIIEKQTDTVIYTRPDSASIIALLKCDSVGNVLLSQITELKTGHSSTASVRVKDNFIFLECKVDSMAVYLSKYMQLKSSREASATIVTVYKERPKTKFQLFIGKSIYLILGVAIGVLLIAVLFRKFWI